MQYVLSTLRKGEIMLDKLPVPLRHLLLIVGATFLGVIAKAILAAQGVTGVHWATTATLALNTAVVTGVTAFMVLYLTPITKQWGAFSDPSQIVNTGNAPVPAPAVIASPDPSTLNQGVPA